MSDRRIDVNLQLTDNYTGRMAKVVSAMASYDRFLSQQAHPIDHADCGDGHDGPQLWPGDQA